MPKLRSLFLCAAIALSGCAITVKESRVFRPDKAADHTRPYLLRLPDGEIVSGAAALDVLFREYEMETTDRTLSGATGQIQMRHIRSPDRGQPLIVFCGGTDFVVGENSDRRTHYLGPIGDVLFWNYPGYGQSEGRASTVNLRRASAVLQAELDDIRQPNQAVVFWGHSLGGFVCADMAAEYGDTSALVLEATAPSIEAAVKAFAPRILGIGVRLKLAKAFENIEIARTLADTDFPVLVLSGVRDTVLPVALSRDLESELRAEEVDSEYREYPNAWHTTIGRQTSFRADVVGFLAPIVGRDTRSPDQWCGRFLLRNFGEGAFESCRDVTRAPASKI